MPPWIIPVILVAGLLLLWLEIFLPGGILGLAAGIFLLGGLVLIFIDYGITWGSLSAFGLLIVVVIMLRIWMKTFNRSFFGKRLVNRDAVGEDEFIDQLPALTGKRGVTLSPLAPSGKALIEGQKLDVVSQIGMLDQGVEIEVIGVDGISIHVRPLPSTTKPQD